MMMVMIVMMIAPSHELTFHLIGQVVIMMMMMIVMMIDPTQLTFHLIGQVHTWLADYDVDGDDGDDNEK